MAKTPAENIRQIWIINFLLDCKKWKQKEIVSELISRANPSVNDLSEEKITKIGKKVGKSLNHLEREGIITGYVIKKSRKNCWWLSNDSKNNQNSFFKILNKLDTLYPSDYRFSSSKDFENSYDFINHVKTKLMTSEYANKIINKVLVNNFSEELGVTLNKDESDDILKILRISPQALLNTFRFVDKIKLIKNLVKISKNFKDQWLSNLQIDLLSDVNYARFTRSYELKIEQKIVTTITIQDEKFTIESLNKSENQPKKFIIKQKYNPENRILSPLGDFRE